jgi:hypothetical protein
LKTIINFIETASVTLWADVPLSETRRERVVPRARRTRMNAPKPSLPSNVVALEVNGAAARSGDEQDLERAIAALLGREMALALLGRERETETSLWAASPCQMLAACMLRDREAWLRGASLLDCETVRARRNLAALSDAAIEAFLSDWSEELGVRSVAGILWERVRRRTLPPRAARPFCRSEAGQRWVRRAG